MQDSKKKIAERLLRDAPYGSLKKTDNLASYVVGELMSMDVSMTLVDEWLKSYFVLSEVSDREKLDKVTAKDDAREKEKDDLATIIAPRSRPSADTDYDLTPHDGRGNYSPNYGDQVLDPEDDPGPAASDEQLLNDGEERPFHARNDKGNISSFASKETRDAAVDKGTHTIDVETEKQDKDFAEKGTDDEDEESDEEPKESPPEATRLPVDDNDVQVKSATRAASKLTDREAISNDDPGLTKEQLTHLENLGNSIKKLGDPNISDEDKAKIAKRLKEEYGLTTNRSARDENGNLQSVKLYIKKAPGGLPVSIRKAFGSGQTKAQSNIVALLNQYGAEISPTSIGGKSESATKKAFSTAAKPDFGKGAAVTASESETVRGIFKPGTVLGDLPERFHAVDGPTNDDGNLIPSGGENSARHMRWMLDNNQATQKTIALARDLSQDDPSFEGVARAFEGHDQQMKDLLDGNVKDPKGNVINVPSTEAKSYVEKINAELMNDLYTTSPDVAPAMAKQIAENMLVNSELANGEQVYLPSAGNFPGGDKIRVTGGGEIEEVVEGISVKFGRGSKGTEMYGFPANGNSVGRFAEVPKKEDETPEEHTERQHEVRTRNGKYVGQSGHILGVRDDIVDDPEIQKKVIDQSGLGGVIKNREAYYEMTKALKGETERFLDEKAEQGMSPKSAEIALQAHLKTFMNEGDPSLSNRWVEIVDREQLMMSLTGTEDGKYTDGEGNERSQSNSAIVRSMGPLEFLSLSSLASTIKEGQGLPSLSHNHQRYEDGEYHSETISPENTDMTDLANWGFQFRTFRTAGRRGGGAQLTGTGEAKKVKKQKVNN